MPSAARASFSLRISTWLWESPVRFDELLSWLATYRETFDEVAFFTGFTHPPLPLAVIQGRAEGLARLMPRVRALGLGAGINHLATLGHLDENLPHSLNEPWQRLMDLDGQLAQGCYCPNDPGMRGYLTAAYRALAAAGPDFIWIDDDVRMEHHPPLRATCFCPRCLAQFSAESGVAWTRELLKAALDRPWSADGGQLRRAWLAHTRSMLTDLMALIRRAVDTVSPGLALGLMSCENLYSGYDIARWVEAGALTRLRPGGGFYTDDAPLGLIGKAHLLGRQIADAPAAVTVIQSEHENFPYQMLAKSATIFGAEIGAYLAVGCTGTALNCLGITADPFEEYRPRFETARTWRPFSDQAVATFGRSANEGVWMASSPDLYATLRAEEPWLAGPAWGAHPPADLSWLGLPLAYRRDVAQVILLAGDVPLAFSDEELRALLAGGVVLDGQAARRLEERGFAAFTGFRVAGTQTADTLERFTDDPLNGRFAGWLRDCRPSFWMVPSTRLAPLAEGSRPLSHLVDFADADSGPVSGVFENALGGRVAIFGYYPWTSLATLSKSSQLKTVLRWLSRDTLPAYVASYHKVVLWARRDAAGAPALYVLNASLDPADGVEIAVRGGSTLACLDLAMRETTLAPLGTDRPYTRYRLPALAPWAALLVRAI